MKTSIDISKSIADYLREKTGKTVFLSGAKDPRHKKDYISVNCLGSDFDKIGSSYVNVNYHVPDIVVGVADVGKLREFGNELLSLLSDVYIDGMWVYLDSDSYGKDSDGTHYFNVKLEIVRINE